VVVEVAENAEIKVNRKKGSLGEITDKMFVIVWDAQDDKPQRIYAMEPKKRGPKDGDKPKEGKKRKKK
jgi:hypothetical protein